MINRVQIHEYYKKVKIEEIFMFQVTVLKFGDLLGDGSQQKVQYFSSLSSKL